MQEKRSALISHVVTKGLDPNVKMKDTGVAWLGGIPAHWKTRRLKHICSTVGRIGFRGYTTDDQVNPGEGALVLGASHIKEDGNIDIGTPAYISWDKFYESPEIMVEKGDLLVVQRGSCGRVGFVDTELGPATINPSVVLLKKITIPTIYLFYFLQSHFVKSVFDSLLSSTAVPMLSQFQIENLLICLSSEEEMSAISRELSRETFEIKCLINKIQISINILQEYRAALISAAVTGKIDVH